MGNGFIHPAIAVRKLGGDLRSIVRILASSPGGLRQVEIRRLLGDRSSQSTVSRMLSRLAKAGIVVKSGKTRDAIFRLTPEVTGVVLPPHLRPRVGYDPRRIGEYDPNRTQWLPERARERMIAVCGEPSERLDASTYSREIAERLLIDLSWASSVLEGNTYDYLETESLIRFGQEAQGHDRIEALMILNHKRAISLLLDSLEDGFSMELAARLHALLMRDLVAPEYLGRTRASGVRIGGSSYDPSDDPHVLRRDLGTLLWKAGEVEDPLEAAFMLFAGVAYLQAFVDGNKRMSRLLCNVPLLASGMPPLSFVGMDKDAYLTGVILFYETGDPGLLAEVVAESYVQTAPIYAVSTRYRRVPGQIQIREHERIEKVVRNIVRNVCSGTLEIEKDGIVRFAGKYLADLPENEHEPVLKAILDVLDALGPDNAIAWAVPPAEAREFAEKRDGRRETDFGMRPS